MSQDFKKPGGIFGDDNRIGRAFRTNERGGLEKIVSGNGVQKVADNVIEATNLLKTGKCTFDEQQALLDYISTTYTKLEKKAEALQQENEKEPLTGLYRREYFEKEYKKEVVRVLRYENPFSLLIIDLDDFKGINDRFGHLMGDEVLKTSGKIVTEEIRETDIPARYGGDELVVLMPYTDIRNAATVALRIKERIYDHQFTDTRGRGLKGVGTSMGIAGYIHEGKREADEVMKEIFGLADESLYKAKKEPFKNSLYLNIRHQQGGEVISSFKKCIRKKN